MPFNLKTSIRDVPDFPNPGVLFRDISPLLADAEAFRTTIEMLCDLVSELEITKVVGIESRGFIFGAPVAETLGAGFVMARKQGKLPGTTVSETYMLEYGTNTIEIHTDAITTGENVLIVDDVLATGGTAEATISLVGQLGGNVVGCAFVIELGFLGGKKRLHEKKVFSLLTY